MYASSIWQDVSNDIYVPTCDAQKKQMGFYGFAPSPNLTLKLKLTLTLTQTLALILTLTLTLFQGRYTIDQILRNNTSNT